MEVVRGLKALCYRLTADNRIQLRWETFCPEAEQAIAHVLSGPDRPALAFNDHTSAELLNPEISLHDRPVDHAANYPITDLTEPAFLHKMGERAKRSHMSPSDFVVRIAQVWARRAEVPADIARIAATVPRCLAMTTANSKPVATIGRLAHMWPSSPCISGCFWAQRTQAML